MIHFEKYYLTVVEILAQVYACSMHTRKILAANVTHAAALQRILRDKCALAISKTFPDPRRKFFHTYWHTQPILPKSRKETEIQYDFYFTG